MTKFAALASIALLAACGGREPLQPAPGAAMPVVPLMAKEAPTTEALLVPPPLAKPNRIDEPLRRSEEREDDRFDLPPQ